MGGFTNTPLLLYLLLLLSSSSSSPPVPPPVPPPPLLLLLSSSPPVVQHRAEFRSLSHIMDLSGKVAVVTGAAMGIGRAVTETLLTHGATLILLDVNEVAGKELVEILQKQHGAERVMFITCNVESEEQIRAAFRRTVETYGAMDIVFNNAGILNEDKWEKTVSINITGVIRGTYLAMEHMSKQSGGHGGVIINTASMAGVGPLLSCPVYTATKHAVVGFTRAMAAASTVSGYGIRFNALCPGFVQTDLFSAISAQLGQFSHLAGATKQLVEKMGIVPMSSVVEAVLEMATDETKTGEACLVLPKGRQYMEFPSIVS